MKKLWMYLAMSCCLGSLMALGCISTGDFDSALPSGNLELYYCTALNATGFRINDRFPNGHIPATAYGAKLNLKIDPSKALGLALYANNDNLTWELNTKHILWHKDNKYLSITPTVLYAQDDKKSGYNNDIQRDECQVWGGKIPLIYTIDTRRNLLINFSGALSCYWVSATGYKDNYLSYNIYERTYYDYGTMPTFAGHLNWNFIAASEIWIVRPSLGISFIDAHERGIQTELNGGLSLGFPFKRRK